MSASYLGLDTPQHFNFFAPYALNMVAFSLTSGGDGIHIALYVVALTTVTALLLCQSSLSKHLPFIFTCVVKGLHTWYMLSALRILLRHLHARSIRCVVCGFDCAFKVRLDFLPCCLSTDLTEVSCFKFLHAKHLAYLNLHSLIQ